MENNVKQYRRTLKDYSVAVIFFMFLDIIDMLQSYTNGEYNIAAAGNSAVITAVCISVGTSLITVITKLLIGIFGIFQANGKRNSHIHTVLAIISLIFSLFGIFMTASIALRGGYFDVYTTVQSLAAAAVLFLFIRASRKLRKAEKE